MKIPFNKPFTIAGELENISAAVREGHLAGDGRFTRQCHAWLEHNLGARKALLTHSCTGALEMAAILCDLKPGDEVIMPSFTFVSTANAFVLRGAVPVFVDIRRDTLNLDQSLLEAAVTPRTRAIVPVHYAGVGCDMNEIMRIAARHNLVVVEDAAQGILAEYEGRKLGAIGQLGCLSFHETKNVISGEGGALLVNDERFIERAEIIREKGTNRAKFFRGEVDKYTWVDIGSSYLPSELIGAFLWAQLERAADINAKRLKLRAAYRAGFSGLTARGLVELPQAEPQGVTANGHMFYILTRDLHTRSALIQHLRSRGVYAVFHYVPLHSSPAGRRFGRATGDLAVTDDVSSRLVRLPLYYELTEAEVTAIAAEVAAFFSA
ncbi:MAG: dTDP-4-amino-4,6-dideoxygalactose transaminase [Betaproteobacteria bacterium]|nr:dTDP-4-amino-4,6-dideoxygalactose transaminase [Betaproteobacteria bacterium]MDH3436671.1 dTDP-4-amino-4,6-dideoxygalactose transaminase [Betaproteobacteria bacterium]